ncbi:serine hydrolase domain-containing protein [Ornithinibacillus halophilus]|uniref:CubicO group peptidase, beta-lactamase class C family n=1 Tax=Ornithinibacillus halophilus TaxID=930117 RepID=A0A1M5KFB6_9BACI|nr:serine hydrolase domain-containing protein [Ornithinibacillus halophilus]SHG51492.1 CubicO group peptidase, beta-lactamase class C family [Ornithinibacillus halophilus]
MNVNIEKIDEYLNLYQYHHQIPGFAVNIVKDNQILYSQSFGSTSIESPQNRVNADTIFSIQSITKSFTAMALLHSEENTNFSLDDPIIRYLPYFRTKSGNFDEITTRHILSHTAGFPENVWIATLLDEELYELGKNLPEYKFIFDMYPNLEDILRTIKSREDVTRFFSQIELESTPGKNWKYCTDAYVIATDVLEKVSGLTFENYVNKHIFNVLGMNRTFVNPTFSTDEKNVSSYYMNTINTPIEVAQPENIIGAPMGFIYSTANDLSNYVIDIMDENGQILSKQQYHKLFEPLAKREEGLSYGLGWKLKEFQGLKIVEHAGGYPGVSCFISMVPEHKLGIILLSNMDQITLMNVSNKLIRMMCGS